MYNKREDNKKTFIRANLQIRVPEVRVVREGEQLGVMPISNALRLAEEAGMDLFEVVPQAKPPVCHIGDLGKWKYDQKQREKEQLRKQRETFIETKEVRFKCRIQEHDIDTKVVSIRRFLSERNKVQISLQFKGREMAHKDEGFAVIQKVIENLADVADVELKPKLEGNRVTARLTFKE